MLRTLFLFTVVVSAVVADDETTQKSTTCDSFSAAECDAQSGCKAEGDKCVDDVGDGNEGGGGDLFTTTKAAGAGTGSGCADNDKAGPCNNAPGCAWADIEQVCAEKGGECIDITEEASCKAAADCSWSIAQTCESGGDEGAGDGGDDGGQCTEADIVANVCEKLDTENKCKGDEKCLWLGTSCDKDEDYDPNDCAALDTKEQCKTKESSDSPGVEAPGCAWDETEKMCGKNANTGSTGDSSVCSNADTKAACAEQRDEADNQACEWMVIDENAAGGETDCFSLTDATKCNAAKNEDNKQACEWEEAGENADTGGGGGGTTGDDDANTGGVAGQCSAYDICGETTDEAGCEAEQSCQWLENVDTGDMECQGFGTGGGAGGGTLQGCSSIDAQVECEDFSGMGDMEGPGGGEGVPGGSDDGDANPTCLWVEIKDTGCVIYDACEDKHGADQSGCEGNDACTWSGSDCRSATALNSECISGNTKAKCDALGADKCSWVDEIAKTCIDWKVCAHFSEDECEGASEKCWWDGDNNQGQTAGDFCYPGDRPTTVTTSTSTTTTVTTITTTTTFHCTPTKSGEERVICGEREYCIRASWFCDGQDDCGNGFDELECATTQAPATKEKVCKYDQEFCADGVECVYKSYNCDGTADCADKSDEKDCPSIVTKQPRTQTTTTTTTTKLTQTTTTTRTDTSTTAPPCITSGKCADRFMYDDALRDDPLFQTIATCRVCALGQPLASVCLQQMTIGCPIDTTDADAQAEAKLALDKISARKSGVLAVEVPVGTSNSEVEAAVTAYLLAQGIVPSAIIDVELYRDDGQTSTFSQVLIYTEWGSGATSQISALDASSTMTTSTGAEFTVYNSKLVDTSNVIDGVPQAYEAGAEWAGDGFSNPTQLPAAGGGGGAGTGGFAGGGQSSTAWGALDCATLQSVGLECDTDGSSSGGDEANTGASTGVIIGVAIGALILIGGLIGAIIFFRKSQGGGNYKRPPQPNSAYANPGFQAGAGSAPSNSSDLPAWADPTVPFMTRQEAEAQLASNGNTDKDYVVRQSANNAQGYAICSVYQGKYTNFQVKRQGSTLFYGNKPLGQDLTEALRTLQNSVPVAPSGGAQYFLNPAAASRKASYNPSTRVFNLADSGSA